MTQTRKQVEFAGRTEHTPPLTGTLVATATADSVSAAFARTQLVSTPTEKERAPAGNVSPEFLAATLPALTRGLEPAASDAPAPVEAAGQVEELLATINRHTVEFRQFNADSMAVVLKPDAQTEIMLQLVQRDGVIEVNARFERGDFQALNGQWEQLQQSLAAQGIRVGSLYDASQPGYSNPGGGGQGFTFQDSHSRQQEERQRPAYPREEPAFAGLSAATSRPRLRSAAGANRRLETWA